MSSVGPAEGLILLVLLIPFGIVVWGVVDAASHPRSQWDQVGQSKVLWIVLQVGGVVLMLVVGLALSIWYLIRVRPQLKAAAP